jgi:hypothetical protein
MAPVLVSLADISFSPPLSRNRLSISLHSPGYDHGRALKSSSGGARLIEGGPFDARSNRARMIVLTSMGYAFRSPELKQQGIGA